MGFNIYFKTNQYFRYSMFQHDKLSYLSIFYFKRLSSLENRSFSLRSEHSYVGILIQIPIENNETRRLKDTAYSLFVIFDGFINLWGLDINFPTQSLISTLKSSQNLCFQNFAVTFCSAPCIVLWLFQQKLLMEWMKTVWI